MSIRARSPASYSTVSTFGNAINARFFGAACDGTTDDSAALNAALASVIASGSELYLPGVCRCLSDVPQVHQAKLRGPGGILLTSARVWLAEPSVRTAFSARQTLYVDPAGSDGNSGLGPTFPLKTMAGVEAVLSRYGHLVGPWQITLAAGEYTDKASFYGITNEGSAPLYIDGPAVASPWDNSAPPATADVTGGSVPTAIFRPTPPNRNLAGYGVALDFQYHLNVIVSNVQFRDWGVAGVSGNPNEGALRLWFHGTLWANNIHVWNSASAITVRDFSELNVTGGIFHGCRNAFYVVAGVRYQTGHASSAPGQTNASLVRQCTFGLDAWEDATGHADYTIFEDNVIHIHLRRKSHGSFIGPTLRNTGAHGASQGILITEGSVAYIDPSIVWSGTHTPRVQRLSGGMESRLANAALATELMAWATPNQTTSGTTVLTLATLAIGANELTFNPQAIIVQAVATLNNLLSTAILTVRANGVFLAGLTVQLVAAARVAELEMVLVPTDATNQIVYTAESSATTTGSASRVSRTTNVGTGDFSIAQSITVTIACANAADSVTVQKCEVFRRG